MLISTAGVLIRTRAADISEMGRATQGVTLIALDEGTLLAGIEKIGETEDDGNGNGHAVTEPEDTDDVPEKNEESGDSAPKSPDGKPQD